MNSIHAESLNTPVVDRFDVIVAGGGASGLIAAVTAARMGAKTLLVERQGCLGGMATAGAVAQFVGFFNHDTLAVRGIPFEYAQRIHGAGGSAGFHRFTMGEIASRHPVSMYTLPFNPEVVKGVADELLIESGAHLLLHTQIVQVMQEGGEVQGVVVENISGRRAYIAAVVLDCTGDSVVAQHAGGTLLGEEEDLRRTRQPSTLVFRLSGVDLPRFRQLSREDKLALAEKGIASGELIWKTLSFVSTPGGSDAICLLGRIQNLDMLDATDVTQAELEGRRQARRIAAFMKREVPGCENIVLAGIAERVGVRETRRTLGRVTLTAEDIAGQRRFADAIALGCGPMDMHDPKSTGISLSMPPVPFEIPMGTLLPQELEGIVASGRGISATREANGGARHMATAMALGQATGTLGALAADRRQRPSAVAAEDVRASLRRMGAAVSPEDCQEPCPPHLMARN